MDDIKEVSKMFDLSPEEVVKRLRKRKLQEPRKVSICGSCGQVKKSEVNK